MAPLEVGASIGRAPRKPVTPWRGASPESHYLAARARCRVQFAMETRVASIWGPDFSPLAPGELMFAARH